MRDGNAVVFTWGPGARAQQVRQVNAGGVTLVRVHSSEAAMLQAWLSWLRDADPDIINVFQVVLSPPPLGQSCLMCFSSATHWHHTFLGRPLRK
jgi:DNA polymerase elongation subunit (family B)